MKYDLSTRGLAALSARFGISLEYASEELFPYFRAYVAGKKVLLLCDETTRRYASPLCGRLRAAGTDAEEFVLPSAEPVADEATCALAEERAKGYGYVLAVGSGTLNDIAKYTTFRLGTECGVYATAASMDGFTSGVTPLICGGNKVTVNAHTVRHVLADFSVLCAAPRIMTGAGAGDILAKYCCLADWRISHLLKGEAWNEEAASLMRAALAQCVENVGSIAACGREGVEALFAALLVSGYAMVISGNSRPASGAEHHMSHFLEVYFLRRGEHIPLHGVKVGLGTLVSLHMYKRLKDVPQDFAGKEIAVKLAEALPEPAWAAGVLSSLGCPTRFSQIGVPEDVVRDMLFNCWKIRDRYTVMTLYRENDLMRSAADELISLFY